MFQLPNLKQFKNTIIFLILGFALFPAITSGAVLYLEPAEGEYQSGDTFGVEIKIDTENQCINTVGIDLSFSQNILRVIDFSQGESIIILWTEVPQINQEDGNLSFSGGIPGGYCGRIPGDPGESNLLGKIIFRVPEIMVDQPGMPLAQISFLENSQVFLNDGLGTKAELTTQGASFAIIEKSEAVKDEWQEELKKDNIAPELFEIEVHQYPTIFEGKYFITFFTSDKQTGIDYYEVKEGSQDWKKAESPYLLEDQNLKAIIKVRAIDKAGNERIAEYSPEISKKPLQYLVIILILLGIWITLWVIRKTKYVK